MQEKEIVEIVARAICRSGCDTLKITACTGECRAFRANQSATSEVYNKQRREMCYREARDALTALEQAGSVVVPKEPTEAMIEDGTEGVLQNYGGCCTPGDNHKTARDVYTAMLNASRPQAAEDEARRPVRSEPQASGANTLLLCGRVRGMALTERQREIIASAKQHGDRYLLVHLPWRPAETDPDYDVCQSLVYSGHAQWLPINSNYAPGIMLTGKPEDA